MVDGLPHVMDPTYVGATGHYVDLGAGYDRKALFAQRQEIVAAVQAYRSYYPQAYRAIAGAVEARRRGTTPLHTEETLQKNREAGDGPIDKDAKIPWCSTWERTTAFPRRPYLPGGGCCWKKPCWCCVSVAM